MLGNWMETAHAEVRAIRVDSVPIVSFLEFGSLVLTGALLVSACSLTPLFFLRFRWVWSSVQKCFGSLAARVDGGCWE
ncbi:hypothetical protein Nepgr_023121 [Nepenthes gracilis]|uniref:Uncharacterized protein n=1 Tax=Nepenthes gracilis TaxID=150966 RepID=A0AAD3T281_NEPGR|nr:hypothetical protein Nepgr_023121 [Nepenthes gracilis]